MGLINLPNVDEIADEKDPKKQMEMMLNTMGILMKNLSELNGFINSKNVFEQGGWRVKDKSLESKDGDVGMSTEDTTADDVRFYAGGTDKDIAPWRVHKSGKMVATGALIQSADGTYPRIVMDPDSDLFGAYATALRSIVIGANLSGYPYLEFTDAGSNINFGYSTGAGLNISSGGDLDLRPRDLYLYPTLLTHVPNWGTVRSDGQSETLQDALDEKATAGISTSLSGSANGGIPIGTVLMVSGGGTVTWNGIPTHSHAQN